MILYGKLLNILGLLKMLMLKCMLFAQRKKHNFYCAEKWLKVLEQPICVLLEGVTFRLT